MPTGLGHWRWPGLNAGFRIYRKLEHFDNLAPAQAWVLLDEHEDSINGGGFVVDVIRTGAAAQLMDVPGHYHHNACGFSFADGHSEIRRWRDARTIVPVRRSTITFRTEAPHSVDILWLQERTTAKEPSGT